MAKLSGPTNSLLYDILNWQQYEVPLPCCQCAVQWYPPKIIIKENVYDRMQYVM